jgi:HK97 family phage prohead protease
MILAAVRRLWTAIRGTSHRFDSPPRPIDAVISDMMGRGVAPRVGRLEALSVPYIQRGRNLLCSISTLPLVQYGPDRRPVRSALLEQMDPDVPNVVHLAQTVEDLVFEGVAWWRVIGFGWDMFPVSVRRVDPGSVSVDPPTGRSPAPLPSGLDPREPGVYIDGAFVPAAQVIRFDSPNPALLKVCGRTVRRAILLDRTASMYAEDPRAMDYFTPAENADPIDDDAAEDIVDAWRIAKRKRSTAYVPAALKYNTVQSPTPADLQLADLQRQAGLELANGLGVDPEDLGISTTSRTYANDVDRRRDRVNDVLQPYMRAITDRLSMPDVTPRGHTVRFSLDDYMRSNPTERWATYDVAMRLGVKSREEVRAEEGLPVDGGAPAPAPAPAPAAEEVRAARAALLTLDGTGALQFANVPLVAFSVDRAARTIEGLALPYGRVGAKNGMRFRFERGALQWHQDVSRVKLLRDHDFTRPLGAAVELKDTPLGMRVKFSVARGDDGDRALELAEDKVLDGLSVGVDFDVAADAVPDPRNRGVMLVRRADLHEVSLTAMPAFSDARVTRVAAAMDGGPMEDCAHCGYRHAPGACGMAPVNAPARAGPAPAAAPAGPAPAAAPAAAPMWYVGPGGPVQFGYHPAAAPGAPVTPVPSVPAGPAGWSQDPATGHWLPLQAVNAPATVDPGRPVGVTAAVNEPAPYRFDSEGNIRAGSHDFSRDLYAAFAEHDAAAYDRAFQFVRAQFDIATTDVNELNPTRQRPELYVDQREYRYPVWDAISKGTLTDITPFTFPKFSSAADLVAAHTEGVEPSSGTLVTTSQTVTPTAVSGKAKITRETWDQGGNPQVSNLIWRQMVRGWFEALEAAAIALLDAASPTQITTTAGGGTTGQTLSAELEAAFAALHFIRGGFAMNDGFAQVDLYKALTAAKDDAKRPLYPILGPQNANGQVDPRFGMISVGGVLLRPSWALAATGSVAASSYLFDRDSVHGWASTPQRLDFNIEVAHVYIGLWGYKATAISDITGVREIVYDPVA